MGESMNEFTLISIPIGQMLTTQESLSLKLCNAREPPMLQCS